MTMAGMLVGHAVRIASLGVDWEIEITQGVPDAEIKTLTERELGELAWRARGGDGEVRRALLALDAALKGGPGSGPFSGVGSEQAKGLEEALDRLSFGAWAGSFILRRIPRISSTLVFAAPPLPSLSAPSQVPIEVRAGVRLTEVRGLYKPGYHDPADEAAHHRRQSGYLKGYKSQDDRGRIFINGIPRVDPSVSWEDVKAKDRQYIELRAEVDVFAGTLPAGAELLWEWSDPDDPSDASMRKEAALEIDGNDFVHGHRKGKEGGDNLGLCDFPQPKASTEPAFEALPGFSCTPGGPGTRRCTTSVVGQVSEVRFHCTDAGGDNFQIKVSLVPRAGLDVASTDQTGVMTMWKRIDLEHRRIPGAVSVSLERVPTAFAKGFVQLDIRREQLTQHPEWDRPYLADERRAIEASCEELVRKEFKHHEKPGWFFFCSAREASSPQGEDSKCIYDGEATIHWHNTERGTEQVFLLDVRLEEEAALLYAREGDKTVLFFVNKNEHDETTGNSRLGIDPVTYHPDFEPGDGSEDAGESHAIDYFPLSRYFRASKQWEAPGLGLSRKVHVNIHSAGPAFLGGQSPWAVTGKAEKKKKYYAGRTIFFSHNPGVRGPAETAIGLRGEWRLGESITVHVDGRSATYVVQEVDLDVPDGADRPAMIASQVAWSLQDRVNEELGDVVQALSKFRQVRFFSRRPLEAGNGTRVVVSVISLAGNVENPTSIMEGGGVDPEAEKLIVHTVVHELGHAFGFPHTCGYRTFEKDGKSSCCMNYPNTWLWQDRTRRDPARRELDRFQLGQQSIHFCPRHLMAIRLGRLEDNPALWKW